ncbi:MAG TPA: nitroreductase family deazaflavin-dependent oxidoreductase [Candidatus Dormibacteraeota bacterium]|nr:nitroreductase family deazaflavin-dependent oxidoreductase [Candidatus Dormibacteraeota bacterium]
MALPTWMVGVNRRFTNRVLGRAATRLPGFGVIHHRGRRSGVVHRTPVNVFPRPEGYVFALTYGRSAGWVRNVMAAGGCEIETRGRLVRLTEPRLYRDETRRAVTPPARVVLGMFGVADFLVLRPIAPSPAPAPAARSQE